MLGYRFSHYAPPPDKAGSDFEKLLKVFMQLILITSGNVSEALQWLTEVDRQYGLTNDKYGIGDFIEDLKRNGYITEEGPKGEFKLKAKSEQSLRQSALEEIFGKLKKTKSGEHNTHHSGRGDEQTTEKRDYEFGDTLDQISVTDSLRNAQINHGLEDFFMTEEDLEIIESEYKTQTSTVLMIDISHSMILYGEDRITPAKKVAMALAELITKKYPKDTLDILVFGDESAPKSQGPSAADVERDQMGMINRLRLRNAESAHQLERARLAYRTEMQLITHQSDAAIRESRAFWDAKSVEVAETIKTYVQATVRALEIDRLDSRNADIQRAYEVAAAALEKARAAKLPEVLKDRLMKDVLDNFERTLSRIQNDTIVSKYDLD